MPIQKAQRTAGRVAPSSRWLRWARSSAATYSSSSPEQVGGDGEQLEVGGGERG